MTLARYNPPVSSESERRAIRRAFPTSLMSNTKWREVFLALESVEVRQGVFQFFCTPEPRRMSLPTANVGADKYVLDSLVGPFPYYSIIWLELPARSVPTGTESVLGAWHAQDINAARVILNSLGKLTITDIGEGLRISGYSP
jgi:hypothetical protein